MFTVFRTNTDEPLKPPIDPISVRTASIEANELLQEWPRSSTAEAYSGKTIHPQFGRYRRSNGVKKQKVKNLLKDTRRILRDVFNRDGRLLASQ